MNNVAISSSSRHTVPVFSPQTPHPLEAPFSQRPVCLIPRNFERRFSSSWKWGCLEAHWKIASIGFDALFLSIRGNLLSLLCSIVFKYPPSTTDTYGMA
jgi:hypothetical protein